MKKTRYTEEQIAYALCQAEMGTPVAEVVRKMGSQRADFLPVEEAVRRDGCSRDPAAEAVGGREPEAEAARGRSQPRQADASGRALKKTVRLGRRRELVRHLEDSYGVSERRGCSVLRFQRSSHHCRSVAHPPGKKCVSRLFPVITYGAARRPLLGENRPLSRSDSLQPIGRKVANPTGGRIGLVRRDYCREQPNPLLKPDWKSKTSFKEGPSQRCILDLAVDIFKLTA